MFLSSFFSLFPSLRPFEEMIVSHLEGEICVPPFSLLFFLFIEIMGSVADCHEGLVQHPVIEIGAQCVGENEETEGDDNSVE